MRSCGINSIVRNKIRHIPRIIMYHGFCKASDKHLNKMSIDQFRKQLIYIKKHYSPLKVSELILARKSNGFYPENTIAITIDDGYEDFYHQALPILKELNIPATIFIVSQLTEENGWMWPDKFHYIVESIKGGPKDFNSTNFDDLLLNLKKRKVHKRNIDLKALAQKYNVSIPSEPPPKYKLMSWAQLKDITETELIEIGSHSCTHPIISHLTNEDSWHEINLSKHMIEEKLKIEVSSFCYPNGQKDDYTEDNKKMLQQAGYICGIASHFGYILENSDIYSLPRIGCGDNDFNLFVNYLDGIDYFRKKFSL